MKESSVGAHCAYLDFTKGYNVIERHTITQSGLALYPTNSTHAGNIYDVLNDRQ